MKALGAMTVFLSSITLACPPAQHAACELKKQTRLEMDVISSNIANIETTRTPEGGPYRRKSLRCADGRCETVTESKIKLKYEPLHPNANADDYVAYPDMNLLEEMKKMLAASKKHEEASVVCLGGGS